MNVSLTEELEKFVQRKVESGRYGSASEVIREALRLLEEHEKIKDVRLKELRTKINEGWNAAENGELIDGAEAVRKLLVRDRKGKGKKKPG